MLTVSGRLARAWNGQPPVALYPIPQKTAKNPELVERTRSFAADCGAVAVEGSRRKGSSALLLWRFGRPWREKDQRELILPCGTTAGPGFDPPSVTNYQSPGTNTPRWRSASLVYRHHLGRRKAVEPGQGGVAAGADILAAAAASSFLTLLSQPCHQSFSWISRQMYKCTGRP